MLFGSGLKGPENSTVVIVWCLSSAW